MVGVLNSKLIEVVHWKKPRLAADFVFIVVAMHIVERFCIEGGSAILQG